MFNIENSLGGLISCYFDFFRGYFLAGDFDLVTFLGDFDFLGDYFLAGLFLSLL